MSNPQPKTQQDEDEKINLGDLNIKEWSLIILLLSLAFIFVVVGIAIILSITSGETSFVFTGEIDIGLYNAIIIGIAFVAVTLVGQQLGMKMQAAAVAETDKVWLESEK